MNNRTRLNQQSTTTQKTTTSLNESINSIGVFSRRGSRPTFKTTTATPQSSNNKKTVVRRKFGVRPTTVGGDRRRSTTTTKLPDVGEFKFYFIFINFAKIKMYFSSVLKVIVLTIY